jgi:GT2 family glycosyltransferase
VGQRLYCFGRPLFAATVGERSANTVTMLGDLLLMDLSTILPTRNRAALLKAALDALLPVTESESSSCEIIVADGGSTDGTQDLLASYGSRVRWFSREDKSVVEAFNRGLEMATGRVIRAIGDDDIVCSGGVAKPLALLQEEPDLEGVFGQNRVYIVGPDGSRSEYAQKKFVGEVTLEVVSQFPKCGWFIPECLFIRRETLERVGGYDESFRYWGYLDFFFRLAEAGARLRVIPDVIVHTLQTTMSDSITANSSPVWNEEWKRIQRQHNTLYWRAWHELGGSTSPKAIVQWAGRKLSYGLFGKNPRALFGK